MTDEDDVNLFFPISTYLNDKSLLDHIQKPLEPKKKTILMLQSWP